MTRPFDRGDDARTIRALIWAKTYPELSRNHTETVCTGAIDLATGKPIRLYPVPLRYLGTDQQYSLYDVVEISVRKNPADPRPESYKVNAQSLSRVGHVGPDPNGWAGRRAEIFRDTGWHFSSVGALKRAQLAGTHSMGVVTPGVIVDVLLESKTTGDRARHERLWTELTSQQDLFAREYRELQFIPVRFVLRWVCADSVGCSCSSNPHRCGVLDWGLIELGRKAGWEAARAKLESLANLTDYEFRLFMGNLFLHQHTFVIIGMWYPKRMPQLPLL